MKRQSSREILVASFHELMKEKPADKITIQEIVENCGYSPATFYRQFRDKYDLIAWDYSTQCSAIMGQIGRDGNTWETSVREACRYFERERGYLCNLLAHTSGQDSFFRYMSTANVDLLCREVARKLGKDDIPEELRVSILVFGYGTAQLICEWLTGLHSYSADQLTALLTGALPEMLTPYLRD